YQDWHGCRSLSSLSRRRFQRPRRPDPMMNSEEERGSEMAGHRVAVCRLKLSSTAAHRPFTPDPLADPLEPTGSCRALLVRRHHSMLSRWHRSLKRVVVGSLAMLVLATPFPALAQTTVLWEPLPNSALSLHLPSPVPPGDSGPS